MFGNKQFSRREENAFENASAGIKFRKNVID